MMKHVFVLCLTTLIAQSVFAFDKESFMKLGKKCKDEAGTPDEDVKKLMNRELASSMEAKCMLACMFKEIGVLTSDGKYDEEGNNKAAAEAFKDDEEKINQAKKFSELCKDDANAVEDDEKGCERAAALHKCAVEKADEIGFKGDK